MSSRSTEQQQETDARRFIFGCYARSFSPPRIQKLADRLTNLDRLGACCLAVEIDQAIGAAASEQLLAKISSRNSHKLPRVAITTTKKKAASLGD